MCLGQLEFHGFRSYYDLGKTFSPIQIFSPCAELNSIRQKIVSFVGFRNLGEIISGRTPYHFTDEMHKDCPSAIDSLSKGHPYDVSSNAFSTLPKIFLADNPHDDEAYYRILGRAENKRAYRWIKKAYVRGRKAEYISGWKVFLPKANGASGMLGDSPARLISMPEIGEPNDIATDTFLCVGSFSSRIEATAAWKYMNGKFSRILLGILKITQDNSAEKWNYVPLQDFTSGSDIDWSKSILEIDRQLYAKYGLDDAEIAFIESHVKEMQ